MGYADGDLVILPVSGNDASSTTMSNADAELAILLAGTREIGLTHFGKGDSDWSYDFSGAQWDSGGGAGGQILFPFPYDYGRTITEIHFAIEVVTNGGSDDLLLQRRSRTPVAGSMPGVDTVATIDGAIWNGLADGDATEVSYTGLSYTMEANYVYWLHLRARAGVVCTVHEAMMKSDDGS